MNERSPLSSKLVALLHRRLTWINLPGAILVALLQRTPAVNLAVAADDMVASSPIGVVLKAVVASVAALGAVNSLAGATPLSPSSGSASGITVAAGSSVDVFYTVNGTQTPAMSWTVSGSIPPGLNFSGLTAPGTVNVGTLEMKGTPTTAGTYDLMLTVFSGANGTGFSDGPYAYTVTVTGSAATAPAITTQPQSQTVTAGASVTFTAAASGSPAPTYQWQKGGANITGATNASYSIASVTTADAGTYTVVATNSAGSATSNGAMLTVNAAATAPAFTTQPQSQTVTAGSSVTFTVAVSGSPTPTFQWKKDGAVLTGVTTASYTITSVASADAGTYTVVATNSAGSATSNPATLTVNPPTPAAPAITTQPAASTVSTSQRATFTVSASGTPAPTYQWQRLPAGSTTWENLHEGGSYQGVTSATLTVTSATAAMSGDQFRAVLTNASGSVTTSTVTLTVPGPAAALLEYPAGIAVDAAGNLYVADAFNNVVQKISSSGSVSTLAGAAGMAGNQDGTGTGAMFSQPEGVAVDGSGNVYVADTGNSTIRKITAAGVVTTLAGSATTRGRRDGAGTAAQFNQPNGVALDGAGNLYVADSFNATIRKIAADGTVTTLAGTAGTRGDADGTGAAAAFNNPQGVAVDSSGNVYVADTYNDTIRKITSAGVVTTLAGSAGISGSTDLKGINALFNQPVGVVVDGAGNVEVADTGNGTIRIIASDGTVTTLAGTAGIAGLGNSSGGVVLFNQPRGVAVDSSGNTFVADTGNADVRKIATDHSVTTMALTAAATPAPTPAPMPTPPPPAMTGNGGGGAGGGGGIEGWLICSLLLLAAGRWIVERPHRRR